MFFHHRIIAAMLLLGMLSACGQKGALFLDPQSVPYRPFSSNTAPLPANPASAAK